MVFRASWAPQVDRTAMAPEVDDRNPDPEVVPLDHATLEPAFGGGAAVGDRAELATAFESSTHSGSVIDLDPKPKKTTWKKKRCWLTFLLLGILLIAGALGGYLGYRFRVVNKSQESSADPSESSPSPTKTAGTGNSAEPTLTASNSVSDQLDPDPPGSFDAEACKDKVCRQIFSAAAKRGSPSSMWVFARGGDKTIWYREGDGVNWTDGWKSLPGKFESQPSAASIDISANYMYTAVLAVDHSGNVQINQHRSNEWAGWRKIEGLTSMGAINVCTNNASRLKGEPNPAVHAWVVDSTRNVMHWSYTPFSSDDPNSAAAGEHSILDNSTRRGGVGAAPAATCRGTASNPKYDYIAYSPTLNLRHSHLSGKPGNWSDLKSPGGRTTFFPDPVAAYSETHTEWFGISGGGERAMYHLRWQVSDGTFTGPTKLGNVTFESVPSVLVAPDGSRIDVVALADDHKVKHRAWLASSGWADKWEDMGVYGNSAPLLYTVQGAQKDRTALMVLGYGAQMNFTSWEVTDSTSWAGLVNWKSAGGRLTSNHIKKFASSKQGNWRLS
ncbi:hypothetical protein QBC44DRAFT_363517 [Cladorrhinum sp. PSN332]|nr:hypothetical protein QBC44DRAFT_363517 [Cladorrhinum sp. PSN332]